MKCRLAVMGSGAGSNFQFIAKAIKEKRLDARIVLVLSDHEDALILKRAQKLKIPCKVINCGEYRNKFPLAEQARVAKLLMEKKVDFVCLAGFMRLVKEPLLKAFPNRILNIHPALLPQFPGVEAWAQALKAGVDKTGCTVHYVDEGMDSGAIISQRKVSIKTGDTADELHKRIQTQERILYPRALRMVISSYRSRQRNTEGAQERVLRKGVADKQCQSCIKTGTYAMASCAASMSESKQSRSRRAKKRVEAKG